MDKLIKSRSILNRLHPWEWTTRDERWFTESQIAMMVHDAEKECAVKVRPVKAVRHG